VAVREPIQNGNELEYEQHDSDCKSYLHPWGGAIPDPGSYRTLGVPVWIVGVFVFKSRQCLPPLPTR